MAFSSTSSTPPGPSRENRDENRPGHLCVCDVTKSFAINGHMVEVIAPISLTLEKGEFGALIGPSGCGKSTLLRMIADILPPSGGSISIGGHAPDRARREHEIGFVFQDPTLLPWRSVMDNIRLPLEVIGKSAALSGASPQELIDLVGLTGFEHARPAQLSGGMQQRVAIARALILSPSLLLLDEPFGALDEIVRYRMNLELLRIRSETHTTSLMVTHSIQEAVFMADRIFVLAARPGRIVDIVEVEVERPRRLSQMNSPAFAEAVERVRTSLFGDDLGMLDE